MDFTQNLYNMVDIDTLFRLELHHHIAKLGIPHFTSHIKLRLNLIFCIKGPRYQVDV